MADITIQFPYPINQSCQEGDTLYYAATSSGLVGGFRISNGGENADIIEMGPIKSITNVDDDGDGVFDTTNVVCDMDDDVDEPTSSDFIFFGKPRGINEASIIGYYGEFTFRNNSREKAELFTTACEITESSK